MFANRLILKQMFQVVHKSSLKILLLYGGNSEERAVSLQSGRSVFSALKRLGFEVQALDPALELIDSLKDQEIDIIVSMLHGGDGENGNFHQTLVEKGFCVAGSSSESLALAMDKMATKQCWQEAGLPVIPGMAFHCKDREQAREWANSLSLPLAIKPTSSGSSFGVSRVEHWESFDQAFDEACRYGEEILVESWIKGEEYTVGLLNHVALPSICVQPKATDFYDFHAKYESRDTVYLFDQLTVSEEKTIKRLATSACQVLEAKGVARIDFIFDGNSFFLLEANLLPGMTETSLLPKACQKAGMDFDDLVLWILNDALNSSDH